MTAITASPLPNALPTRELLEGLLGRDVDAKVGAGAVNPAVAPGAVVGVYTDDTMAMRAIILCDLPLAAYVGAAIALVPVAQAEAAAEEGVLPANLSENVAEVFNVAASLFNAEGAPHVKLYQVYGPGEALPADVAKWVLAFVRRLDMTMQVAGYGGGRVSILAL